jgi:uncharacterized oligopeptide transporter (OPT) family protein
MSASSVESVTIRRAPKFFSFLVTGAVVGLLVGLIWFVVAGNPASADWASVLALVSVIGAALGALLGVAFALVVERIFVAKTKSTTAAKLEG